MHERPSSVSPAKRAADALPSRDGALGRVAAPRRAQVTRPAACALCGELVPRAHNRHPMVSPYGGGKLLVCRACRRVALDEGYLPSA